MRRSDLLRTEAELQRHVLRAQLNALRRQPSPLVKELLGGSLGAAALGRVLPRAVPAILGGRAPWVVYGWLTLKALRLAFPRRRPVRQRRARR